MTPQHRSLRVRLTIPAHIYLAHYRDQARSVHAQALDGTSVEFPADALRRHVSRDGVFGLFDIVFDNDNRLVAVERVGE